jgi:ubiquinol-cytochrome c reductase iron-sulfur subunit
MTDQVNDDQVHDHRRRHERSAERRVGALFGITALAALGLAYIYIEGGQPQLEGLLLAVALGALGIGFVLWGKLLLPHDEITEDRPPLTSDEPAQQGVSRALERGEQLVPRRSFLTRMLAAAAGALGLAALFPIRSLGPSPGRTLFRTAWRPGVRLVQEGGEGEDPKPVTINDLAVNGVLTVFPEGFTEHDKADSQVILIRVQPDRLSLREGRESWAPQGHVAYSKVCTHAGCPVGLYQTQTGHLLCPCHQSTFDALNGAKPIFGPATRSLPQLPITVDDQGFLVAQSDFTEAVGPAFWERP